MRTFLPLCGALLVCAVRLLPAQNMPQTPHDLVKDVVYNELEERRQISLWQYRVDKQAAGQTTELQQVETRFGPVNRVLARQGHPLDEAARKKETDRLDNLLRNPSEQARMKQDYDGEEQRVQRLISTMPDAFLYTYDGTTPEGNLRLLFRPNPAYNPHTYEARVFHGLAGEIWVQPQRKRLAKIIGHIDADIDFGYGFLGKIAKGGSFQIGREQVAENRWKTSLIDVHISGKLAFFKAISKDQRELRSAFRPVPAELSMQDAIALLAAAPAP